MNRARASCRAPCHAPFAHAALHVIADQLVDLCTLELEMSVEKSQPVQGEGGGVAGAISSGATAGGIPKAVFVVSVALTHDRGHPTPSSWVWLCSKVVFLPRVK